MQRSCTHEKLSLQSEFARQDCRLCETTLQDWAAHKTKNKAQTPKDRRFKVINELLLEESIGFELVITYPMLPPLCAMAVPRWRSHSFLPQTRFGPVDTSSR
jgi:hypothetical protein